MSYASVNMEITHADALFAFGVNPIPLR